MANRCATGSAGPLGLGIGLAYVGERIDTDFDAFPAERVTLGDYVLGSLNLAYRITPAVEAYARLENAFDADYQVVVGYNPPRSEEHTFELLSLMLISYAAFFLDNKTLHR